MEAAGVDSIKAQERTFRGEGTERFTVGFDTSIVELLVIGKTFCGQSGPVVRVSGNQEWLVGGHVFVDVV